MNTLEHHKSYEGAAVDEAALSLELAQSFERARENVAAETLALKQQDLTELQEFSRRKDQSLLELTRRSRRLNGRGLDDFAREKLNALRLALADNQAALQVHLDAARAISQVMMQAISDEDSDRTYSMKHIAKARRS